MPVVHPTSIVTFSSEDPNHPASNLLNRDTYRKWKCKEVGEKEAFVVLKFDKAVQLTGMDIGNDCSAMVEVHVARSGGDSEVKYEPLLSSSMLMSPADCRTLNNPSGVRNYTTNVMDRETASQKWDLVKIVVSQTFNRQTKFGLTFVKFTAAPDPDTPGRIGVFPLRKPIGGMTFDDDEDEDSQRGGIGAMFAKRMANKNKTDTGLDSEQRSTSAAIREASKEITSAAQMSNENKVKDVLKKPKLDFSSSMSSSRKPGCGPPHYQGGSPGNQNNKESDKLPSRKTLVDSPLENKKSNQNPNILSQSSPKSVQSSTKTKVGNQDSHGHDTNGQLSSSSDSPRPGKSTGIGNNLGGRKDNAQASRLPDRRADGNKGDSDPTSSLSAANSQTGEKEKEKKPFDKLFDGVVFVMSGFENPYRKNLRDRAIEMGANCKYNWDSTCTHLICAFVNTPKFRDVRRSGHGKIVRKEWIERSYGARCRFPWRRFCLDRNDKGDESEEEIEAETDSEGETEVTEEQVLRGPSAVEPSNSNDSDGKQPEEQLSVDSGTDETTHKKEREEESGERKKRKRVLMLDSSEEEDEERKRKLLYEADTDVDEDDPENNSSEAHKSKPNVDSGSDTDFEEPSTEGNNDDKGDKGVAGGFFENSGFFLSWPKGDPLNRRSQIEQIISKRKGRIETELTDGVDFIVTNEREWDEEFSEALSDNPNLVIVNSDWILKCESANKIIPYNEFMVIPT